MTTVKDLPNDALMDKLHDLVRCDRQVTAELLRVLMEVDRRKVYAERGYPSLFAYCLSVLNMSEPSIGVRIHAARCCQRFPLLIDMLHSGQLHLSAIIMLAPHLRADNVEQLTALARHKSKRQLQQSLADLNPKPDVPESIRKLPAANTQAGSARPPSSGSETARPSSRTPAAPSTPGGREAAASCAGDNTPVSAPQPAGSSTAPSVSATGSSPASRPSAGLASLEPLGGQRYKLQLTASQQLKDKLEHAGDLLRHRIARGDMHGVIEHALDRLIAAENKRQHGATDRPRAMRQACSQDEASCSQQEQAAGAGAGQGPRDDAPRTASRHIPNAVKREVYARDGGRCSFVSQDGHRCTERGGLQYHHEVPFGKGGPSTTANVRLLCRAHNALLARHDYGQETIEACIEQSRQRQRSAAVARPLSGGSSRTAAAVCSGSLEPDGDRPQPRTHKRPAVAQLPLQPRRCGAVSQRPDVCKQPLHAAAQRG
jgi:5-methylcytosine-specific restriction endonuclease McrA